jgi:hypothetical protein
MCCKKHWKMKEHNPMVNSNYCSNCLSMKNQIFHSN